MSAGESRIKIDEYEHYNYEDIRCGKGGKNRTKTESLKYTNQHDTCGHTRKIVEKLANSERNKREIKK